MAATGNELAFDLGQAMEAAGRWEDRTDHHKKFDAAVRKKQYTQLDTAERCADRANHLISQLRAKAPEAVAEVADEVEAVEGYAPDTRTPVTAETVSDALLERVIGKTRDFQFVEFLECACTPAGRSGGSSPHSTAGG